MTRWVGWLVAWCGVVVCLLWSLLVHAGGPPIGWHASVGPWSHTVPTFFTVFRSTSPLVIRIRADALESSARYRACVTAPEVFKVQN